MLGYCEIYSRLFVLICAAVMPFIMCSHAARASPIITGHRGERSNVIRGLNTPHSQHRPLSAGLQSKDGGTETNFRDTLSVINHQSRPEEYIQGSFSYRQNYRDDRRPRVRITKMQRGGVRPASSISTDHSLHGGRNLERWPSRSNDYTVPQKEHTGTSYKSRSVVIRKSHNEGKVSTSDSLKVDEDKFSWNLLYPPLFPSKTSRHLMPRPYPDYKETTELPLIRTQSASNEIQPSKVLGFTRQNGNSWDATVGERNPSQEQLTPYLTNYPKKLNSVSNGETLRYKKFKSYLFQDSVSPLKASTGDGRAAPRGLSSYGTLAHKQSLSGAQEHSQPITHFKPFSRVNPTKQDSVAQSVGPKQRFTELQIMHPTFHISPQSPSQTSSHPSSVGDKHLERSVPSAYAQLWDKYAARGGKVVVVGRVNATTRDLTRDYKSGRATKGIFQSRELIKPVLQPAVPSGPAPTETTVSQQSSLDKGRDYRLKTANAYRHMSQKYSFGQRRASATTTVPAKAERMDNSSPSPGALNVTQLTAVATPRPFTTAFKHIQHLLPENDASMGRNTTQSRFRLYKGTFGLEGLGRQPLEGAKALAEGPNVTVVPKPGFEGFKLNRLETWQPKGIRIHKWYNQTGAAVQGGGSISTASPNELSSDGFKPLPESKGSNGSTSDEKHSMVRPSQGFRTIMNRTNAQNRTQRRFTKQNPATTSHIVSSGYMRPAGRRKVASRLNSRQRAARKNKLVPEGGILRNASTSITVRGKRVKQKPTKSKTLNGSSSLTNATGNAAIVRLRKPPAKGSPITYADILGSASFSSVEAASQTPTTLADGHRFPNTTTTEQKGGRVFKSDEGRNVSNSPEASADGKKKDFKSDEEADNDVQTADLFLDHEGSGAGGFNLSDVLSTVTGSQAAGKDSLELDYLRISTGNISFKSAKQSDLDEP